jgi:hypothetical protein
MTPVFTPERWAFEITHVLNAAFGADRFPIDIPMVALEYSKQRFPDDPIVGVKRTLRGPQVRGADDLSQPQRASRFARDGEGITCQLQRHPPRGASRS